MKGDFSKDTFRKKKHFHDVHMQQGRVLLDSDWNEQADIYEHRIETGTLDIVGKTGAPFHYAGFDIVTVDNAGNPLLPPAAGTNINISEGRFYVDGIMCENDASVLFAGQPDFDKTALPAAAGRYLFYLDVWQRHITALEDSALREVALGGPDTTTRNKTIWQVKFVKTAAGNTCVDLLPASITDAPSGKLMARTELPTGAEDPCGLAVSGGYRRLENQLYRVEIHKGAANRAGTTFKWSRDNGSVVVKWDSVEAYNADNLVVSSTGRDELLGFKSGDWIEMIDDKTDLLGFRGPLVQLSKVDGNVLTINPSTNIPGDAIVTAGAKNSRILRWDSAGEIKSNTNNTDWIELEDGVQVQFKDGSFRTGDYWLIPARTATADIEWPYTNAQSPQGIEHHFAQLAMANFGADGWSDIKDCRNLFPTLTELTSLYYLGGDGQEAMPGNLLPDTLKVGVANGGWAIEYRSVKFEILSGGGMLNGTNGPVIVSTNVDGLAECSYTLGTDTSNLLLKVKASLADSAGNVLPDHLSVIFNAAFSIAGNVAYSPECNNWPGEAPKNVAEALDQLCERKNEGGGGGCCSITVGRDGDFATLSDAILTLAQREKDHVSLCLLPGQHLIDKDIDMLESKFSFSTLHITGVEAYIIMNAGMLRLKANKIVIDGFQLTTSEAANITDDPPIVLIGNMIIIDRCIFDRNGESPAPFVYIKNLSGDTAEAYISNSSFLGSFSLTLADGIQGVLEKNIITFLVLQNRDYNNFSPNGLFWPQEGAKKILREKFENDDNGTYIVTDWVITIRGNRVGAIISDLDLEKPFNLYQNLFISENIFQLAANNFLAKFLNVVNNQFLFEKKDNPVIHAYVFGVNAIIIGNNGSGNQSAASGGINLLGIIDIIVLSMIRGNGTGPSQLLNLVNVVD